VHNFADEEIVMPKGSDEKFVSKLNQIFDENAATKSIYFARQRRSPMDFAVRHFAGDVTYCAKDFMEKNKDALAESLMEQMQTSTIPMLVTAEPAVAENTSGRKKGSKMTLAAKFKQDLDSLMTALRATVPHFIRCVKPNADQAPDLFDANLTLNQLKYSGLFEAIRIRKAGYAVRMPNEGFAKRYKHVLLNVSAEAKADPVLHCQLLLEEMHKQVDFAELAAAAAASSGKKGPTPEEMSRSKLWVVGKTKVFIRTAAYKLQLEKIREKNSANCSVPLQKIVRGFIMRSRFVSKIAAMRKATGDRKALEAKERDLMAKEEIVSWHIEKVFRNDGQLQKKLADAKASRIKFEQG
jgi:myosin heavy subunit